jgi:hypothetical protein
MFEDLIQLPWLARSSGLHGSSIPLFSSFSDPLRYAGSSPSVHYLKAMFVDWLMAHRIFIERAQASLPANVMKVDHTFDVCFSQICLESSKLFVVPQIHGRAQW